jgi:(1->4)-alpha-D-glucan 1-alpha-D-glucosylmutase
VVLAQLDDVVLARDAANLPGTTVEHPNWRRKLPPAPLAGDRRLAELAAVLAHERPRRRPGAAAESTGTRFPRATYRVQLHRDFRFADACAIVPYLARLGVSHLYCSPFLRARAGSRHGYDIVDHNALNPEIGTREDFERLVDALHSHGMGLLVDVVPNHMGVLGADNAWWMDVLENGRASPYSDYFDIEWQAADPDLAGRVLVPILGDQYGVVLERGELKLAFEADHGGFVLRYFEHRLPLDPATYPVLLDRALALPAADALEPPARDALASLAAALGRLPARDLADPAARAERHRDKEVHKATLARLAHEHAPLAEAIDTTLAELNGDPHVRTSVDALDALVGAQAWRLAYWRVAADEINYRRFFDINDLAALRMENPEVFEATHRLLFELLEAGRIDGLRIDHPDGLLDPAAYFARLQRGYAERMGATGDRPLYVVAEKIVAPHEQLPSDWAVHGTTGYRFANVTTGLLIDGTAKGRLDRAWRAFVGDEAEDFETLAYRCRRLVMATSLAGELTVLAAALLRLARADRRTRDFTLNALRQALAEIVAGFPVYRTYIADRLGAQDRRWIDWAVGRARRSSRAADASALEFIHDVLRGRTPPGAPDTLRECYLAFARRLQQFTAPVAAKGIEDTAFYRHHRLVALNEVGGDPDTFGVGVGAFHGASRDRALRWPHTMLATTTHDTKRSEDVRARLAVLSEMPAAWRLAVRHWHRINRSHRRSVDGAPAPSRNDEYLLYQTLVGTLPEEPFDEGGLAAYRERITQYWLKAAREAKRHTSWISPNAAYEDALAAFIGAALARPAGNLFLDDLREAVRTFAWFGALNSIAVTLLKLASPGVPDIYQGQEGVVLSLVDPDNRRPVDFAHGARELDVLQAIAGEDDPAASVAALFAAPGDGRAKRWVTWRALQLRSSLPRLFEQGDYVPLAVSGARAAHVVAFLRRAGDDVLVVACGRLFARLGPAPGTLPVGGGWQGSDIALPDYAAALTLRDALTGRSIRPAGNLLALDRVFDVLPFSLLSGRMRAPESR